MTTITSRNNNHSHHHRGHLPSHSTNHVSGTISHNSLNNIIAYKRKPRQGSVVTCPRSHTEFAVVEHQGPPAGTTLVSTSDPLARIPHRRCWGVEKKAPSLEHQCHSHAGWWREWRGWSQAGSTLRHWTVSWILLGKGRQTTNMPHKVRKL